MEPQSEENDAGPTAEAAAGTQVNWQDDVPQAKEDNESKSEAHEVPVPHNQLLKEEPASGGSQRGHW